MVSDKNKKISNLLYNKLIPKNQIKDVFAEYYTDASICKDFMGFVKTYYYLSKLIPKHWTVIDFGCGYNTQCFLFRNHKKYIAIDASNYKKFKTNNCIVYNNTLIREFIKSNIVYIENNIDKIFAICNYVPGKEFVSIKENFNNLYIFYPSKKIKRRIR